MWQGRLDADSEGLLLLTDDGQLQARIADPRFKMEKTYLAQVEGIADDAALQALSNGVLLNDGMTLPARARAVEAPRLPVGPRPAHSRAANLAHLMDRADHPRRPQPPSTPHDVGRRGSAHITPNSHRHWPLQRV